MRRCAAEGGVSVIARSESRCYLSASHFKEALWRSGDAADCKSVYPGSIPGGASRNFPKFAHARHTLQPKGSYRLVSAFSDPVYSLLTNHFHTYTCLLWRHPPSPNASAGVRSRRFFVSRLHHGV